MLADVEFLEYQRRDYLEAAMVGKLAELCGGGSGGGVGGGENTALGLPMAAACCNNGECNRSLSYYLVILCQTIL